MARTRPRYPQFGPIVTERVAPLGGRDRATYRLVKPLVIEVARNAWCVVPAGTVTNYASIPRCLHGLYPPDGPWGPAAVWHDFLYGLRGFPRHVADACLLAGMTSLGVPRLRRWIMYLAVRMFGGLARRPRKPSVAEAPAEAACSVETPAPPSECRSSEPEQGRG